MTQKRITISLPQTVYQSLKDWASKRGQPVAPAASIAIELLLKAEQVQEASNA